MGWVIELLAVDEYLFSGALDTPWANTVRGQVNYWELIFGREGEEFCFLGDKEYEA